MSWPAICCVVVLLSFQYFSGNGMLTGGVSWLRAEKVTQYSEIISGALNESVNCGNTRANFTVLCATKQV